jgi:TPR repeat protein
MKFDINNLFKVNAGSIFFLFVFLIGNLFILQTGMADENTNPICNSIESCLPLAEKGNDEAQFGLGILYYFEGDYHDAVNWLNRSAENGNVHAQYRLAGCYVNGEGTNRDLSKAVYWYKKAAAQGDSFSQHDLCLFYYQGEGVPQNYKMALYWCKKSAEQGDAGAQMILGSSYCLGQGVQQNPIQCYGWLYSALNNHDAFTGLDQEQRTMAGELINNLFMNMNKEQQRLSVMLGMYYKQKYVQPFVHNAY